MQSLQLIILFCILKASNKVDVMLCFYYKIIIKKRGRGNFEKEGYLYGLDSGHAFMDVLFPQIFRRRALNMHISLHMLQLNGRLPWWLSGNESVCNVGYAGQYPWVRKIPWRREWLLPLVFLPGEFHGQRCLVGQSHWGFTVAKTHTFLYHEPSALQ